MKKHEMYKISLTMTAVIFSFLSKAHTQFAYQPGINVLEPFPSNPVGMQTYINRTIPNIALVFDNSITMEIKMRPKNMGAHQPTEKMPRRIDIVKDAFLQIIDEYQGTLNFSYANITDYARDLHWKVDPSQPSGYDFSPYHGTTHIEDYPAANKKNLYESPPFSSRGRYKDRTAGTGRYISKLRARERAAAVLAKQLPVSFANPNNTPYIGGVVMQEEALPNTTRKLSNSVRNRVGQSLLVPYQDMYSIDGTTYTQAKAENHKKALELAIRTTGLRVGYVQDIYPNYVDYMADKVRYRCQETYMIIVTDGNTLTNSWNRKAAQKFFSFNKTPDTKRKIGLRPQPSDKKDKDGFYFNQADFPEQNIRSYAIGIGTNPTKFKRFEKYGGGKAATATYPEDVKDIMDAFIKDMLPSNIFSMTSPAGSFLYSSETTSILVANILTNTRGWIGELYFSKSFNEDLDEDDSGIEFAKYLPNHAVYVASTSHGLIDLSSQQARNLLTREELNLEHDISVDHYLKWLTAFTVPEEIEVTEYNERGKEVQVKTTIYTGDNQSIFSDFRNRNLDGLSESRYLGDVLSSSLDMIGPLDTKIKAPKYLTVGSNDGMFKIYQANPDYRKFLGITYEPIFEDSPKEDDDPIFKGVEKVEEYDENPYTYSFAYIPGTARKDNGLTVLKSMALRAAPTYSAAPRPVHQYNVNGETAFRTTNRGHTFLVTTLGQGGKGAFALNISGIDHITKKPVGLDSAKDQWATNVPLWDTSSGEFGYAANGSSSLGYILGKPVIGRIAIQRDNKIPILRQNVKYAVVIPSGIDGDKNINELEQESGPTLYIYDALGIDVGTNATNVHDRKPGALIKKVTYQIPEHKKSEFRYINSLSEPTMLDLDRDGVMDIGYVGDLNGNLYRIDLRGNNPTSWKLDLIFQGDPSRPILNAPSISRFKQTNVVIFGTGSLARSTAFENTTPQFLYGILENKNFTRHTEAPVTHASSKLITQTITKKGKTATVSNNALPLQDFFGWKLELGTGDDVGESLVQKPIIVNGTIFFQTYIYRENQQSVNDSMAADLMCYRSLDASDTWLYQINALTGGALNENSTYIKDLGQHTSGNKTEGIIDRPVDLIIANTSPGISKDGELISGNEPDANLNLELSSSEDFNLPDDHYITGDECNAMLTNGLEIVCPTVLVPTKPLKPERISIINIF